MYIDKDKLLKAIEEANTDVCADGGVDYGCTLGFSRKALAAIINGVPEVSGTDILIHDLEMYLRKEQERSRSIKQRPRKRQQYEGESNE